MRSQRESGEGSRSLAAGLWLLLLLASRSSGAEPGEPYLVKDINTGTVEPEDGPSSLTPDGGRVFYVDDDGIHGRELWVSDGTPEGTYLVKDIRPGPEGSFDPWPQLTAVGDRLFFYADDGASGWELWVSDGTSKGTVPFRVLFGGGAGIPTAVGDRLFFAAGDGAHGQELWASDGTPEGTSMVKDIRPGLEGSGAFGFTAAGDRLFFSADDGAHGRELWAVALAGAPRFLRADCNGDGTTGGVTDAVFLLNYNFRGGPKPPCLAACDANGDGRAEGQVTDAVYFLTHNFLGGPAPPEPFPNCGLGTEADQALGCETPKGCR